MTFFVGAALVAVGMAVGAAAAVIASRRGRVRAYEDGYEAGYDEGYDEGQLAVAQIHASEIFKNWGDPCDRENESETR